MQITITIIDEDTIRVDSDTEHGTIYHISSIDRNIERINGDIADSQAELAGWQAILDAYNAVKNA